MQGRKNKGTESWRANQKRAMKKVNNRAEMTALLTKHKPFSLQRLTRDFNEIKSQIIAIPGVSAVPLDDNFYEWHGNIKCLSQNVYKGSVLHFSFLFPKDYPRQPPKITLLNEKLTHPNVMGDKTICLDILEEKQGSGYKGWKPIYSVLTILLQLQNFFFEIDEKSWTPETIEKIKAGVISMGEFNCRGCKHKGSTNPYPQFLGKVDDLTQFKLSAEQFKDLQQQELSCFYRKTNYKESPIGLGISINKIQRTGEIKGVVPCFDFISLKAYTKEKIRNGLDGARFSHWFPIYFGYKPEEYLKGLTKSISMIAKGNTKQFDPELFFSVMPKFFNNVALNIISEKVHNSSRGIKILLYWFRCMWILAKAYPVITEEVNKRVYNFISDEKNRIKEQTPSLGDLLVMISWSTEYKIETLLETYIVEQMDRQIFWILQELPQIEELINSNEIDNVCAKVCFKCGLVGQQLLLFYYYFLKKIVYNTATSLDSFAAQLDQNYSNLTESEIDTHRWEVNNILKIDNFNDYYKYWNLTPPKENELNDKLKQSFANSLKKGYHGTDEVRFVPTKTIQAETLLSKYPKIGQLMKDNQLLPENDPNWIDWMNKFEIVVQYKYAHPKEALTPLNIMKFQRLKQHEFIFFLNKPAEKKENVVLGKFPEGKYKKVVEDESTIMCWTWRQMYLKLYLEEYVKYFNYTANFKEFYSLLDIISKEIVHFTLFIDEHDNLKSDYNYVRVLLSKLINLKYLCFIFNSPVTDKLLKNIMKGVTRSSNENSEITHWKIMSSRKYLPYSSKDLNILTVWDKLDKLRVLDLSETRIDFNASLRIRNHLYYFKRLEVWDLSGCDIEDIMAKEIADGIMKAKALAKLYIDNNRMLAGISSILYNLAFQPGIKVIDISSNPNQNKKETATAMYKLLKMSQTIEVLIASDNNNLNAMLENDFFSSLGDSISLIYLDWSNNGKIKNVDLLGRAIAFNAIKNGWLSSLWIAGVIDSYATWQTFIQGMNINEDQHVNWYSFQLSEVAKDSPLFYQTFFHCKLKYLDISHSSYLCPIDINDVKKFDQKNILKDLLSQTKTLHYLNLSYCQNNHLFYSMLANALHAENNLKYLNLSDNKFQNEELTNFIDAFYVKNSKEEPNPNCHLIGLDWSKKSFGYNGIELISRLLKVNKTLKHLNLFHNCFDVNGARRWGEALEINTTLETWDVGYNRIKNLGMTRIMEGIKKNKQSSIKFIGMTYNFIDNNTFMTQMNELMSNTALKIERITLKNNYMTNWFLSEYYNDSYLKGAKAIKTDVFDSWYFSQPEKLEKTVWMNCGNISAEQLMDLLKEKERNVILKEKSHLGIVVSIRKVRGRKTGALKNPLSNDCFIEFILPNSVNRLMKIASTSKFIVNGKNVKVAKAGTKPDFIWVKGEKKRKK